MDWEKEGYHVIHAAKMIVPGIVDSVFHYIGEVVQKESATAE